MAPQITLTLDLNRKTVTALGVLLDTLEGKTGDTAPEYEQMSFDDLPAADEAETPKKSPGKKSGKAKAPPAKDPEPDETEPSGISMTDVRAEALKLSKAGKQAELKKIFAKYDAEKLSDISEDDYPALMADLEAANG